VKTSD
jgi:hypothetical protein